MPFTAHHRRLTARLFAVTLLALGASCSTTSIRVPVLRPAPINLVAYELVAVDSFDGHEGCGALTTELAESLRNTENPLTGQVEYEALSREEVDRMLDDMRGRRGEEWDERNMEVLERWRKADVVVQGQVSDYAVEEQIHEQEQVDRQGNVHILRTRQCVATIAAQIETSDPSANRVLDSVEIVEQTSANTNSHNGTPEPIDHGHLLAEARRRVIARWLKRVLPRREWVEVKLYTNGELPELEIGNGYAQSGNWRLAVENYEKAVERSQSMEPGVRAMALYNAGVGYEFSDRFDEARSSLQESYALGRDKMALTELQRVDRRESEVARLMEQGAQTAEPAR